MSDTAVSNTVTSPVAAASVAATATAEKKSKEKKPAAAAKAKKPKSATAHAAPSHPPTQQMVDASIKNLKERGGSSLLAI